METTAALFSQAELCQVAGIDHETANNWVKRGLLDTAAVGGRKMHGRRLFSLLDICKAHLMNEAVRSLSIPPSHCAEIANKAITQFIKTEKLGHIEDGQDLPFAVAVATRHRGQWVTELRSDQSPYATKEARQVVHPLALLPISQAFTSVHRQCAKVLRTGRQQAGRASS
jgi:hypothetical protein